jgi:phosphoribosylformylglycinamidine synthase subunit PurS
MKNDQGVKMNCHVAVIVTPKKSILDPQGRTVERSLHTLGHSNVATVRVGKYIELELSGTPEQAEAQAHQIARDLLVNPVIEEYTVQLIGALPFAEENKSEAGGR